MDGDAARVGGRPGRLGQRIANINALRRRAPPRGPHPREITSQTRTPAGPGAAVTGRTKWRRWSHVNLRNLWVFEEPAPEVLHQAIALEHATREAHVGRTRQTVEAARAAGASVRYRPQSQSGHHMR